MSVDLNTRELSGVIVYVIQSRGKASRVEVQKAIYLMDRQFVRRRIAASMALKLVKLPGTRIRNETGLKYFNAKLGPFSPKIQNVIKRLLSSGTLDEVFEDGRFVYVVKQGNGEVKEYMRKELDKFVTLPMQELIDLALKGSKFDPSVIS